MHEIYIKNLDKSIRSEEGNLLGILRARGIDLPGSCGGHGSCGKCKVFVEGEGEVLACTYHFDHSIRIEVPEMREAKILDSRFIPESYYEPDRSGDYSYGIAVDIGTTTLVMYLEDLRNRRTLDYISFLNPQKKYGDDVISRIIYCRDHTNGLKELQAILLDKIGEGISQFTSHFPETTGDKLLMCLSGNPSMLHLMAGEDPTGMAASPFEPAFLSMKKMRAKELGMGLDADILFLPSASAFVGSDIMGGLACIELPEDTWILLVDIGTNGEIVLAGKDNIYCCATAAGPAFEGARIVHGMGGLEGALSVFRSMEDFETIGQQALAGICGSGLIDLVSVFVSEGKIDRSGFLEQEISISDKDGHVIALYPQDIRELQLAKGAVSAGIKTLIDYAGIDHKDISKIYLSGGFGSYLNPESAKNIGLIPDIPGAELIRAGNSSAAGASQALYSKSFCHKMETLIRKAEYIDLSGRADFQEHFIMEMHFNPS